MAYMSQENKKVIAAKLKAVMPKNVKYSLGVDHHSTIVMTFRSIPKSFVEDYIGQNVGKLAEGQFNINHFWLDSHWKGEALEVFKAAYKCLNTDNYDNSDVMTDYFDVGHYVDMQIGKWNRPAVLV